MGTQDCLFVSTLGATVRSRRNPDLVRILQGALTRPYATHRSPSFAPIRRSSPRRNAPNASVTSRQAVSPSIQLA